MHFVGERASMVFHSDREGKKWADNQAGWNHSEYLNKTHNGGVVLQPKSSS